MSDTLNQGDYLTTNQYLVSANGCFFAIIQGDGNFCVYRGSDPSHNGGALWCCSGTALPVGDYFVAMQLDGNLCVYGGTPSNPAPGGAKWCISNEAQPAASYRLIMQNDGNLCVYSGTPSSKSYIWGTQATDPVTGVSNLKNVTYDVAHAVITNNTPQEVYHTIIDNDSGQEQSAVIKQSVEVSETTGWSNTLQVTLGAKTEVQTGIPFVAEGKVEISAEVSNAYTWNGSKTIARTWGFDVNVNVPAHSSLEVFVLDTLSTITLPYSITGTVAYTSGNNLEMPLPGTYTGTSAHDLRVKYKSSVNEKVQGVLAYQNLVGQDVTVELVPLSEK